MDIYFILWGLIQYYFIFIAQILPPWPLEALKVDACVLDILILLLFFEFFLTILRIILMSPTLIQNHMIYSSLILLLPSSTMRNQTPTKRHPFT